MKWAFMKILMKMPSNKQNKGSKMKKILKKILGLKEEEEKMQI